MTPYGVAMPAFSAVSEPAGMMVCTPENLEHR